VNAGPPFVGIDAQTSGVTDGLQNVYSLCEGSQVVVVHPTLKYWPFASSVPQQTPLEHWDESEHGSAVSFPFWHALPELVSQECVAFDPPPPPPPLPFPFPPPLLRQQIWLPVVQ
jgi:hypothetical protein